MRPQVVPMAFEFTIEHGFRPEHRDLAARLFWSAFKGKLGPIMRPEDKALRFLTQVIDPGYAISAVGEDGRLLGVAGFKTHEGAFVGGTTRDLRRSYGRWGMLWRGLFLALLEREVEDGVLLMDGIFVAPEARGHGVGSALLTAIKDKAAQMHLGAVRLDVIDTNPRARDLYARQGFIAGKTEKIGPLKYVFGFSAATRMEAPVPTKPA